MTGELAQIINLITNYNSGNTNSDLFKNNSTYQYCNHLDFLIFKKRIFGKFKEVEIASKPDEWFAYLKKNNCQKLSLVFQSDNSIDSDHKLVGFVGGGGKWHIEACYLKFSDFWRPRWESKMEIKKEDKRVWNVSYGLMKTNPKSSEKQNYNIKQQKNKLKNILERIEEFSASNTNTSYWKKHFKDAQVSLDSENTEFEYHKDLIPENALPKENVQLLVAASKSFVFGGMGSWNDVGSFKDKSLAKKYDDLSAELYATINDSFIVAVNGSK